PGTLDEGYSEKPWEHTFVVAAADGYGFAATRVGKPGAADLTLRLVRGDVPIPGPVLGPQGPPLAAVSVPLAYVVQGPQTGAPTAWLEALRPNKETPGTVAWPHLPHLGSPAFIAVIPPVTTGADGRFEIKGVGGERVASLRVDGPTVATRRVKAMTRPGGV